tara:strand:+ start:10648 stop:11277 length:630 start_codon:yes stop_codon:yes gene_type:complete
VILNTEILVSFILATASLALTPGPDNIFVLVQSISYGKRKGMAVVCGLISGCLIHTSILAFGLSSVIQSDAKLLLAFKLLGAVYMLYLAYSTFKSDQVLLIEKQSSKGLTTGRLFRRGFVMNVINPKVSFFFMAFFPAFLFSKSLALPLQFYILGFLFMLISFMIFTLLVVFCGLVASFFRKQTSFQNIIKWIQIIVFLIIAAFILISN